MKSVAILYVRPPVLGKVKTRLACSIGEKKALAVYKTLLKNASSVLAAFSGQVEIHSSTEEHLDLLFLYFPKDKIFLQTKGDLGERMAHSIAEASRRHPALSVLLFGSDIARLQCSHLDEASEILKKQDVVLGPANDGGYYLIGFSHKRLSQKTNIASLFRGMSWSHEKVFSETQKRLERATLSVGLLPKLRDLDDIYDLFYEARQSKGLFRSFLPNIKAVLPVYNEADNLRFVLRPLLDSHFFSEIICADNNSTDKSREIARSLGVKVSICKERGYGATCLSALAEIRNNGGCDIVVFLDGDGSDEPLELPKLLAPLLKEESDFVLGARLPALAQRGSLFMHQRFGNALAVFLIRVFFGYRYMDLGPMRAIRWQALEALQMDDRNFGWTIQMQLRALKAGLRIQEIPVSYRKRHLGRSKVTATLWGSFHAGRIILWSVFRERFFGAFKNQKTGVFCATRKNKSRIS